MGARNPQIAKVAILREGMDLRTFERRFETLGEIFALAGLTMQLRTCLFEFAARLGMEFALTLKLTGNLVFSDSLFGPPHVSHQGLIFHGTAAQQ
jgi:hypothetical protein